MLGEVEYMSFDDGKLAPMPSMADILTPGESGNVKLEVFVVENHESLLSHLAAMNSGNGRKFVPPGRYVRLLVDTDQDSHAKREVVMMSDTPHERHESLIAYRRCTGDVLIAGLGLGMLPTALASKPDVTSVTVVEVNEDVIKLVAPFMPAKVRVVHCDIWEYEPDRDFDSAWFDFWPTIGQHIPDQMDALRRRFSPRVNGWIGAWLEPELRIVKEVFSTLTEGCMSWNADPDVVLSFVKSKLEHARGMVDG